MPSDAVWTVGTPGLLPSRMFWLLLGAAAVDTELAWPICFANATCADGSAGHQAHGQRYLIDIDVEGPQGGAASTVFLRRPHFDPDQGGYDMERPGADPMLADVPRRFARLQRRYGRWGLAYLESLLRAADWAASGNPSKYVGDDE